MKMILIPTSKKVWDSKDMEIVRRQAIVSARRISKGIDIRLERVRFTNACNRIQDLALLYSTDNILQVENSKGFFKKPPAQDDFQLPFIEPNDIKNILSHEAMQGFHPKLKPSDGIVLFVEAFTGNQNAFKREEEAPKKTPPQHEPDYSNCEFDETKLSDENKRFHKQIRNSIATGVPLGWININGSGKSGLVRHEAIVSAIREYLYVNEHPTKKELIWVTKSVPDKEATERRNSKWFYRILPLLIPKESVMKDIKIQEPRITQLPIIPNYVRFAYEDGSLGTEIPLFGLLKIDEPMRLPIIKASLISGRHFELDAEVDICLIRNAEISRREEATIAEQEQLSFDIASKFLTDYFEKNDKLELHLYHTGLEPAVIGTYRAILNSLINSEIRGKFKVIPKMFRGYKNGFENLKSWH